MVGSVGVMCFVGVEFFTDVIRAAFEIACDGHVMVVSGIEFVNFLSEVGGESVLE
jgi:hypothetical protein